MRVLIFGATGMLGKALVRQWHDDEIIGLGSADADLRNPEQVQKAVADANPDWIVLAAAYTDVDGCEINPTLATSINTYGAVNVANAAVGCGSKLLFVSTDYVFDGKKSTPYGTLDARNPINAYGKSKSEAEQKLLQILPECCIVRTSWLFGLGGKCFPDTIVKLAETRPEIKVVSDQRGSPTYTHDLADAIIRLCHAGARGIIHATNHGDCTWYEFACEIVKQSGRSTRVRPTTSTEFVRPAERPGYSVLSPSTLLGLGIQMPAWQDALRAYIAER